MPNCLHAAKSQLIKTELLMQMNFDMDLLCVSALVSMYEFTLD